MTAHQAPLTAWHEAIEKAIHDRAYGALPLIFVRMARDGWGHEAEEARRALIRQIADRDGERDTESTLQHMLLVDAYRQGGIERLRQVAAEAVRIASPDALAALLVEGVLTGWREHQLRTAGERRRQEDFDLAEAADEAFRERTR